MLSLSDYVRITSIKYMIELPIEEVGELAKAIRKANGQKVYTDSKHHDIEEEAADVLFMLLDVCNRLDIDLEKAFVAKEVKNNSRTW